MTYMYSDLVVHVLPFLSAPVPYAMYVERSRGNPCRKNQLGAFCLAYFCLPGRVPCAMLHAHDSTFHIPSLVSRLIRIPSSVYIHNIELLLSA